MDEELNLDLDLEEDKSKEIISRKDKKINSLSEKLGLTEKEKAEAATKLETEGKARAEAEKERDFFKSFTGVASKYLGASEYQEKIWEKVKAGYDVEDAAIAVLNKEGKFTPPAPVIEHETAAGGSAATGLNALADKPIEKLSREEMRSQLLELEQKGEFEL